MIISGQAQALHIAPYPDSNESDPIKTRQVYREQIYNSWWNGYLLGYPEHFIDSYCFTFYNEQMSLEEKQEQVRLAKRDTKAYFKTMNLKAVTIGIGLDESKFDEFIAFTKTY